MVGKNETYVSLFLAGNGTGKSAVGANIVKNICFPPKPDSDDWKWFNLPLYTDYPYELKRGRIISDPTTLKEKIAPELKRWFPSNRVKVHYDTRKEGRAYEARWETDTGWTFDLLSTEQESKEAESVDLSWLWIDEPCPRSIYLASIARLRRGGFVFWTLTPLYQAGWIKDELYDKRDGKNVDYVKASIWDNCKDIEGTRGMLAKVDIERMISQFPEDEQKARIDGEFGHILGLVHKGFDPKVHVIEPFDINDRDYTLYMALDCHPRIPDALLWMAVDQKGNKIIFDELYVNGTTEEIVTKMKRKEDGRLIRDRLIDPSSSVEDKHTREVSLLKKFQKLKVKFRPGSKKLHDCIRRTDDAFRFEKKNGEMIKKPEVYIFSTCRGLIKELQNYAWQEWSGKSADMRDPKPQPIDRDDHMVENLHRLLIEEFKWRENPVVARKEGGNWMGVPQKNFDKHSAI